MASSSGNCLDACIYTELKITLVPSFFVIWLEFQLAILLSTAVCDSLGTSGHIHVFQVTGLDVVYYLISLSIKSVPFPLF